MEASLANVFWVDRFSEVSEKTKMMEAIEVPGLHRMETNMGVSTKVVEVEIGSKCFKNVVRAIIYEEVGMSQYFKPLVMN